MNTISHALRLAVKEIVDEETIRNLLQIMTFGYLIILILQDKLLEISTKVEFLPPGMWPYQEDGSKSKTGKWTLNSKDPDRISFLESLAPVARCRQTNLFRGYQAFIYKDNRIVLENPRTGNALYLIHTEYWVSLATETKWGLLRNRPQGFIGRVIHSENWKETITSFVSLDKYEVEMSRYGSPVEGSTIKKISGD